MKIYINRKPVEGPWGGGNLFVTAMHDYLPLLDFELLKNRDLLNGIIPDVVFLQSPKPDSEMRFSINDALVLKKKYPQIKIIMRVNDCDARKGTEGVDDMWLECSKYVDKTIFVSNWMKEYFIKKGWKCKINHVVYNGVNLSHFKERDKIKNGKINIVTHHWSNNRMKGFDIYEELDRFVGKNNRFTFTYIGRDLGTFKNTKIIKPLFGEELGKELSRYDVYISGSKFDPGPNHILESIACGIPTIVRSTGGGALELAGFKNIFENFKTLEYILSKQNYVQNPFKVKNWQECMLEIKKCLTEFNQ